MNDRLDDPHPDDTTAEARPRAVARSARLVDVFTGAGASKESGIGDLPGARDGPPAEYDHRRNRPTPEAVPAGTRPSCGSCVRSTAPGVAAAAEPQRRSPGHRGSLEQRLPKVVVVDAEHRRAAPARRLHARHSSCTATMQPLRLHRRAATAASPGNDTRRPGGPASRLALPRVRRRPAAGGPVWFGEGLPPDAPETRRSSSARAATLMLIVGTSGVGYPAAAVLLIAKEAGADGDRRQSAAGRAGADLRTSSCGGRARQAPAAARRRRSRAPRRVTARACVSRAPSDTRESGARTRTFERTSKSTLVLLKCTPDGTGPEETTPRPPAGWRCYELDRSAEAGPGRQAGSPGLMPAAARRTTSATRRARVSGRLASRTQ